MLLPIRSKNPPESLPVVTIILILINVVVYAATTVNFLEIKDSVANNWGLKPNDLNFIDMNTSMFPARELVPSARQYVVSRAVRLRR